MGVFQLSIKDELAELKQDISFRLIKYVENKPKSYLIQETGIHHKTLQKLINGVADITKIPSFKTIRLLGILHRKNEVEITDLYKDELNLIKSRQRHEDNNEELNSFSADFMMDEKKRQALAQIIMSPNKWAVFLLASSNKGVKINEARAIVGDEAESILHWLRDNKICEYCPDQTYRTIDNADGTVLLTRDQIQTVIPHLNNHYRSHRSHSNRNYIKIHSEKINRESLSKIHEILSRADNEIAQIVSNPDSFGEIPFYTFLQLDTLKDHIG